MAVLNDLPNETLVELLSLLSGADLVSTILVSHRFRNISQPLLYRAPFLAETPTIPRTLPTNAGCSLGIFLRTLLTPGREALGSCVRSLHVELNDHAPDFEYPDDTKALMTTIASRLMITSPFTTRTVQLMILLDLLPHLHALHINPPNKQFIQCAKRLPRGLRSLREIHFNTIDDISFVKWKPILRTMFLPSIQRMCMLGGHARNTPLGDPAVIYEMGAAAGTSTVTHLRFSHAWTRLIAGDDSGIGLLYFILQVPIALTHFSFTVAKIYFDVHRSQFMNMFAAVRPSLQYLHIDFRNVIQPRNHVRRNYVREEMRLPYDKGSLRDWPVLRTLSSSLLPLLGNARVLPRLMDRLPPSLRELEILADPEWVGFEAVEHVLEVLSEKEWAVPRLEKLAVMSSGMGQSDVDQLTAACAEAGVAFVEDSFCW